MLSLSTEEQKKLPPLTGTTIECTHCGKSHKIQYGEEILPDGSRKPSKFLAYYKCGGKAYLCGIAGKRLL